MGNKREDSLSRDKKFKNEDDFWKKKKKFDDEFEKKKGGDIYSQIKKNFRGESYNKTDNDDLKKKKGFGLDNRNLRHGTDVKKNQDNSSQNTNDYYKKKNISNLLNEVFDNDALNTKPFANANYPATYKNIQRPKKHKTKHKRHENRDDFNYKNKVEIENKKKDEAEDIKIKNTNKIDKENLITKNIESLENKDDIEFKDNNLANTNINVNLDKMEKDDSEFNKPIDQNIKLSIKISDQLNDHQQHNKNIISDNQTDKNFSNKFSASNNNSTSKEQLVNKLSYKEKTTEHEVDSLNKKINQLDAQNQIKKIASALSAKNNNAYKYDHGYKKNKKNKDFDENKDVNFDDKSPSITFSINVYDEDFKKKKKKSFENSSFSNKKDNNYSIEHRTINNYTTNTYDEPLSKVESDAPTTESKVSKTNSNVEPKSSFTKKSTGKRFSRKKLDEILSKNNSSKASQNDIKKKSKKPIDEIKVQKSEFVERLKKNKNEKIKRLKKFEKEKNNYPINYYKKLAKYFDLKKENKLEDWEYEQLGKLMNDELLESKLITSTDNEEFLEYFGIELDPTSKKKRLKRFKDNLEVDYKSNLIPIDYEKFIRKYFDLNDETLNKNEIDRLGKQMEEEILIEKLSINIDPTSKEKRLTKNAEIIKKLNTNDNLGNDDVRNYFGLNENETSTQKDLLLLYNLLKGEAVEMNKLENQSKLMAENKIQNNPKAKKERLAIFKNTIQPKYEIGKVKYFVSKYFNKNSDEIQEKDIGDFFKVIKTEIQNELPNQPEKDQNDLLKTLSLMNTEINILRENKDDKPSLIKIDQNSINNRLKRFKDTILPDYKSDKKKLSYKDRISYYFDVNLDNYSPDEIELYGHIMDSEIKMNGMNFIDTDDQFLKENKVDIDKDKRVERIKKHQSTSDLKNNLKELEFKNIIGKYYGIDKNNMTDEDLNNFSICMVDEITNDEISPKLEKQRSYLAKKGIKLSLEERKNRKLKFKNEIEPQLKSKVKNLDYSYLVTRYFDVDNIDKLNKFEIGRLKRLMDKEIRSNDKLVLNQKYNVDFDKGASKKSRKIVFLNEIEPDYKKNLNKLNYEDRIKIYFELKSKNISKDDLEKLGKLMEDELNDEGNQFPCDNDLFLNQLGIKTTNSDKKKRILKLKNALENNPILCDNHTYLLSVYYDIKNPKEFSRSDIIRLINIMEDEQIKINGDLIANQLKDKSESEKLLALLNLLQLKDIDKLKNNKYKVYLRIEEDKEGELVGEYNLKFDNNKSLNEEIAKLEKENAAKINEIKNLIEKRLKKKNKNNENEDKKILANLKKEYEKELELQNDLKLEIKNSELDDRKEQLNLKKKLEDQKKSLEEKRQKFLKEESEKLKQEAKEKLKKELDGLEEEEKMLEIKEIESIEKLKNEKLTKIKKEHSERKKRLLEDAEKAFLENEHKLKLRAEEFDQEVKNELERQRISMDEEYKKIKNEKESNKNIDSEKQKLEENLRYLEKKLKEKREKDEKNRKIILKEETRNLEKINTEKLKKEAERLENEAKIKIKEISTKLEEEMNKEEKNDKSLDSLETEMNKLRDEQVEKINQENRKLLEDLSKKLEEEAMITLDELAKKLDEGTKISLEKLLDESRKEHEKQLSKLKEVLNNMNKK